MGGEEVHIAHTVKSLRRVEKAGREMERVQLKGMWSPERIIFSMKDINDLSERERLTMQKLKRKDCIWEEMRYRAQVEDLTIFQWRFILPVKEGRRCVEASGLPDMVAGS